MFLGHFGLGFAGKRVAPTLSLGTLLSASLLIEVVMGWPGLGPLFLDAILARDFAVVLAVILLSTTFLVVGNLIADLLLYRLDPRIRVR